MILEWQATPINDMFADTVLASLLQSELIGSTIKGASVGLKPDRMHFKECLIEALQDIFGENSVPKLFKGDNLSVTVNGKKADINLSNLVRNFFGIEFFFFYLLVFFFLIYRVLFVQRMKNCSK